MIKERPILMVAFTDYKTNVDAAEQKMFEACVKAVCEWCRNSKPLLWWDDSLPCHIGDICEAAQIHAAFPERSKRGQVAGDA